MMGGSPVHRVAVGSHSCREQVQAARIRGVGVPGWAGPDDGAVGQLSVPPAPSTVPERFQ